MRSLIHRVTQSLTVPTTIIASSTPLAPSKLFTMNLNFRWKPLIMFQFKLLHNQLEGEGRRHLLFSWERRWRICRSRHLPKSPRWAKGTSIVKSFNSFNALNEWFSLETRAWLKMKAPWDVMPSWDSNAPVLIICLVLQITTRTAMSSRAKNSLAPTNSRKFPNSMCVCTRYSLHFSFLVCSSCEERKYEDGEELKVCIPVEPPTRSSTCKTAPDCGFSVEESDWSVCDKGLCRRVVQK